MDSNTRSLPKLRWVEEIRRDPAPPWLVETYSGGNHLQCGAVDKNAKLVNITTISLRFMVAIRIVR